MTPLVIGLAIVVVVILIAVAVGLRYVRNDERDDFADEPADRGRARDRQVPSRDSAGQRGRPERPPARLDGRTRSRENDDDRASRRADRGYSDADSDRDGRLPAASVHAARGFDDRGDEPDFRTAQRQEARSQARSRAGRGKRDDDGDWPSTEWDKLSDADYWKEVASDRPLVTTVRTAQPAADPRLARQGQDADAITQAGQLSRRGAGPQRGHDRLGDAVPPPTRSRPQPTAAGRSHEFLAAPAAAIRADPVPADSLRPDLGRPELGRPDPGRQVQRGAGSTPPGQRPAIPLPADDDPLTSPSFPKIVTSDSRSYRSGRPSAAAASSPAASRTDQVAYGAPSTQWSGYGQAGMRPADGLGTNGYGRSADVSSATTAPRSYRPDVQLETGHYGTRDHPSAARAAGTSPGIPAGLPQPALPPMPSPLPAVPPATGNPYGSYVSAELPGHAESPAGYQHGHPGNGYQGYPAGPGNGHDGYGYRYGPAVGDSASPGDGRAASWYPETAGAIGPAPVAQAGRASAPDGAGTLGHVNGYRSPAGYSPAPYPDGRHDVPGYPAGGYGGAPQPAGYRPSGRHTAGPDPAGYLPPEFYRRDGYGGQWQR